MLLRRRRAKHLQTLAMFFVLVLCIVLMHSGMEEQLCRMPEFKQINQIILNHEGSAQHIISYCLPETYEEFVA